MPRADPNVMVTIGSSTAMRSSVCHSATICAHALMYAGTANDSLVTQGLGPQFVGRATQWAKFSATAGLGVIHRGYPDQIQALRGLAMGAPDGCIYVQSGALYALGFVLGNNNNAEDIITLLLETMDLLTEDTISHGACLGLGLAALGTDDEDIYEAMHDVATSVSASGDGKGVSDSGYAGGIGLGLVLAGTLSPKVHVIIDTAHETHHEKIIRGLALGAALATYGKEEEAETLVAIMTSDEDPIIRCGGMYDLALAYSGTTSKSAIKRLLRFIVSDVSDEVKRTAALALGFVLSSDSEQATCIVSPLSRSYNPHVRYGAAMALGISCAGTCFENSISLLQPLLSDGVDFVRQGGFIGMAMLMIQATQAMDSRVGEFRRKPETVLDVKEDTLTNMGKILASGILDAGGRNVTIKRSSMNAVIGLAVFTHY